MIRSWSDFAVVLCGILLLAIVLALIFSRTFRHDLLSGQGKARVLGLLSVEGVAFVVLTAILMGGLLHPILLSEAQSSRGEVARHLEDLVEQQVEARNNMEAAWRTSYQTVMRLPRWLYTPMVEAEYRKVLEDPPIDKIQKRCDELDNSCATMVKLETGFHNGVTKLILIQAIFLTQLNEAYTRSIDRLDSSYADSLSAMIAGDLAIPVQGMTYAATIESDFLAANDHYREMLANIKLLGNLTDNAFLGTLLDNKSDFSVNPGLDWDPGPRVSKALGNIFGGGDFQRALAELKKTTRFLTE